jgi:signal transduction histidine kinase
MVRNVRSLNGRASPPPVRLEEFNPLPGENCGGPLGEPSYLTVARRQQVCANPNGKTDLISGFAPRAVSTRDAKTPLLPRISNGRDMKVLHLEDRPLDARLADSLLRVAWPDCEITVVSTKADFLNQLESGGYKIILADFTLPGFSGLEAFELSRQRAPDIPFIFLTGTLDEDSAIDALERGVTDYVIKEHIKRLVPVVRRAVLENDERLELQQLNAKLEERVRERTARLEEAMKELEGFSYSVSHDLRSPLRAIDGFARALKEVCGNRLDPEGQRLLGTIRSETKRMSQLIEDLLAFSRAGRQQLDASLVDMTDLALSAFQNLTESTPDRIPPVFDLQPLPKANGDRSMLRQVFANLLSNAVKFSSRQASPAIVVRGWSDEHRCTYSVQDNGVGFDPEYADKLFGVFQRLHSEEEFEGTGVGLALTQRIVQRHGGNVWAEGAPGAGATFYFSLPVRL